MSALGRMISLTTLCERVSLASLYIIFIVNRRFFSNIGSLINRQSSVRYIKEFQSTLVPINRKYLINIKMRISEALTCRGLLLGVCDFKILQSYILAPR